MLIPADRGPRMAVESENVRQAMAWLAQGGHLRAANGDAETLVQTLAVVVFQGDAQWPEHSDQADSYRDALSGWLGADEPQFADLTGPDADPGTFVDWFLPVVAGWEGTSGDSADSDQDRYSESAKDVSSGLTYRYDRSSHVYEWYDEAGQTWRDQEWADQHAAVRRGAADSQPAQAAATGSSADPAPLWDESWKMFYRVDGSGTYQFADAVTPGDESSGCGGTWLSREQAAARGTAQQHSATAAAPEAHAAAADAVHDAMVAAVESAFEAHPELRGVLTDEHIKAVLADVAREVIG